MDARSLTKASLEDFVQDSFRYDYAGMELPRFSVINEQNILLDLLRAGTGEVILPVLVASPYEVSEVIEQSLEIAVDKSEIMVGILCKDSLFHFRIKNIILFLLK